MPNTMTLISTVTVGAGGSSAVDLASIPATYTDLLVKISARGNVSSGEFVNDVGMEINNVTTATYSYRGLTGTGYSTSSFSLTNQTYFQYIAMASSSNSTSNTFGNTDIYIPNYAGSTNKSISVDTVSENNGTTAYARINAGIWANTAAINKLTFYISGGAFAQYSTISLYGILKGSGGATVS